MIRTGRIPGHHLQTLYYQVFPPPHRLYLHWPITYYRIRKVSVLSMVQKNLLGHLLSWANFYSLFDLHLFGQLILAFLASSTYSKLYSSAHDAQLNHLDRHPLLSYPSPSWTYSRQNSSTFVPTIHESSVIHLLRGLGQSRHHPLLIRRSFQLME